MCFHVVGALHVVEHRVGLTVSFRTRRQTYTHGQEQTAVFEARMTASD